MEYRGQSDGVDYLFEKDIFTVGGKAYAYKSVVSFARTQKDVSTQGINIKINSGDVVEIVPGVFTPEHLAEIEKLIQGDRSIKADSNPTPMTTEEAIKIHLDTQKEMKKDIRVIMIIAIVFAALMAISLIVTAVTTYNAYRSIDSYSNSYYDDYEY